MTVSKAVIAQINLGVIQVEGLMLPNSNFAIGVSQLAQILPNLVSPTHETRSVKRLLGISSPLARVTSEINSRAVNIISLEEFEKVLVEGAIRGDSDSINLLRDLVGLSLTQLWSDGFRIKFEKQEREEYLVSRVEHLKEFHKRLTPWWKQDGCVSSADYIARVVEFKDAISLPKHKRVDDFTLEELRLINSKEIEYHAYRKVGLTHDDAIGMMKV